MLYSQLFTKTQKASKQYDSANATLLIKGGFIDQVMAGVYAYLPLGNRVLSKIENVVREEMNDLGQEVFLPAVVPAQLWKTTGRLETVDVLTKVTAANKKAKKLNDAEYILCPTHEDVITPIAKKFNTSYKDLPKAVYQIQTKFRNEPRPKSGLMRCREFRMKDLYSFHTDEKDFQKFYEHSKKVYTKIFDRLGLGKDTIIAVASGGDFTKEYSHEFQTRLSTGEDTIFYSKKRKIAYNKEVAPSETPLPKKSNEKELLKKDVKGVGIIGVEKLSKFLKVPVTQTTKTLLFENEKNDVMAVAVRGDRDVSEYKFQKILGCHRLHLASEQTVKKVTGAKVGYAGPMNLPKSVKVFFDTSMRGRVNFECGANKTDYHTVNVNFGRDLPEPKKFYDIKIAQKGDLDPESGEPFEVFSASEVGNIFSLGTKFSKDFGYTFNDEKGKSQEVFMGSYGIGTSRAMGVIVEKFHDEKGIVWPENIAPFKVHLVSLGDDEKVTIKAEGLYKELQKKNIEVLYDDRVGVGAGQKLSDADLIGCPYRFIISQKTKNKIEVKRRDENNVRLMTLGEAISVVSP